jgi:iron complex outermembrane receptor protein
LLGTTALCLASTLFAATAANAADAAAAAPAAADDVQKIQEIVVTARARSEKLLEVPISVQAFTAATLAANNISDLNTLQTEAGFTFNSQNASYAGGGRQLPNLIFRGLASNSGFFGSSGALFVDGIAISGGLASVTLSDASQVEVLKGPQNVYFGKNTFGGAVNLITSNPSEDYHGSFSVGYSDKGSYDDTVSAEGAIIPGLLTGRITGELFHQGEQYKSADGGPLGEEDTKGVTLVLYATPTPDVWVKTRFHYSHDDDSTSDDAYVDGPTYGTACAGMVNKYFCGGVPSLSSISPQKVLASTSLPSALLSAISNNTQGGPWLNKVPSLDHSGLARDTLQGSVQGGAKLPYDATLQYSAGYNSSASLDIVNADHTPNPFFYTDQPLISRDFEADARILTSTSQKLRAVLGVNYFQSLTQLAQGGDFFGVYALNPQVNTHDKTYAGYGSLEYDILSNVTATGEVRYQSETVYANYAGTNVQQTYNHALPRIILKYEPQKGTNIYLSYSEGVQPPLLQSSYVQAEGLTAKSGSTLLEQALAGYGASSALTQDPKLRVWELGWKQSLFSNRVSFSVDYYNQFWDNAQVNTFLFDPVGCLQKHGGVGGNSAGNYPANTYADCPLGSAGSSITAPSSNHIQGIEFDGTARVTSTFTAHGTFNWTDAIRTNYNDASWGPAFTSGVVPSQNGKRVNEVPEFQASVDGTYKDHLFGPYDWFAHGVVNYTSSVYTDANDIGYINGYARVNLSAGITRGNLRVEAFVSNLLDDKNWDQAVRFPSPTAFFNEAYEGVIATAPNPRDFGFKISDKF